MDDNLELPTASVPHQTADDAEDDAQSSDDEDGALDWTKLPSGSSSRPYIPKRGEKEYEPTGQTGTLLQQHKLQTMREAMFTALDVERTVSNKAVTYGLWDSSISRAHVVVAHGSHLMSMGHSVQVKSAPDEKGKQKMLSHVQLLPEEALYLIERGSMFCRKTSKAQYPLSQETFDQAVPMTLQEAYAEMIGKEDITLDRYLVFSYLKRLGYIVTRATPPSIFYPKAQKHTIMKALKQHSWISSLTNYILRPFKSLFASEMDWWKPLRLTGFLNPYTSYSSMFVGLRLFRPGFSIPLYKPSKPPAQITQETPYKVFYNLYKPGVSFAKTNPRPPDFSIVVVNARTTLMPTIHELSSLFEELPELPPPVPRQRRVPPGNFTPALPNVKLVVASPSTFWERFKSWCRRWLRMTDSKPQTRPWKPNPFQVLKNGKRIIVVAAVESGMISFYRFGQGVFEELPMM